MPTDVEEYVFTDELERIERDMNALLDEMERYNPETPHFAALDERGELLEVHREGIEWALDEWDVDSVALGALTSGEFAKVQHYTSDDSADQAVRNVYVAVGTSDAPYVGEGIEETIVNVADSNPYFVRWAESKINGLLSRGDSGNSTSWRSLQAERFAHTESVETS